MLYKTSLQFTGNNIFAKRYIYDRCDGEGRRNIWNLTSLVYSQTDNTLQRDWLLCHMTDHHRIKKYVPRIQQVNLSTDRCLF